MKKSLQILALLFCIMMNAQAPAKFSYQAVIRNASDALITNSVVGVKITILKTSSSGAVVYAESQAPTTNANGLISIQIGSGTVLSGSISGINWSADSYFIKTETDPLGGSNYNIVGTTQLLSVPYALYSKSSGSSFTLPYTGTSAIDNVIPFRITNSSSTLNQAGYFENTSLTNSAPALSAKNNSTGSFGIGIEGRANSNTNGNESAGVSGVILGTGTAGAGVSGYAQNADGISGTIETGNAVRGLSYGTGTGGSFQSDNTGHALTAYGPITLANIGEGSGKVLTSDGGGNATWQTPAPASSLVLPYLGVSSANNVIQFRVTNNSTTKNKAGLFENTDFANDGAALSGQNNSINGFGVGVQGIARSNTNGAMASGVQGYVTGNGTFGAGVYGMATDAFGVYGSTDNGSGIKGISFTSGTAGSFQANGSGKALEVTGPIKLNNIGAGAGKVLTSDGSGNATWQLSASGLTLPYAAVSTVNSIIPFSIKNSSATLYSAASFENTNIANTAASLRGVNNSTGGFSVGVEGRANSNNNGNISNGVKGIVEGTGSAGAGVYGAAKNAYAVYGNTDDGVGIKGVSLVTGTAASFVAAGTGIALDVSGPVRLNNIGEAPGKVLTSDSSGNATWQDLITPNVHFSSVTGTSQLIPTGTTSNYINSWNGLEEAGGTNYNQSTGEYTIPITGYYYIMSQISFSVSNSTAGGQASVAIIADGFTIKQGFSNQAVVGQYYSDAQVHIQKKFNVGQKIKIAVNQYGSPSNSLYSNATNFIINFIHK